jgi:hypothetical protein
LRLAAGIDTPQRSPGIASFAGKPAYARFKRLIMPAAGPACARHWNTFLAATSQPQAS